MTTATRQEKPLVAARPLAQPFAAVAPVGNGHGPNPDDEGHGHDRGPRYPMFDFENSLDMDEIRALKAWHGIGRRRNAATGDAA